jgi:hypothetical protein
MRVEPDASTRRGYPRQRVRIPVHVQVTHTWQGTTGRPIRGLLSNVSQGGGGLSLEWIVPPRTRLSIQVPSAESDVRLLAEVVWTSVTPGRDAETAAYGVRWIEYLSRPALEALTGC